MNKIGFNLLTWSAGVSEDLFPITDRLKEIGYDGVEVLIGSTDEKAYKSFGAHVKNIGLEVTTVFILGKEENPIDKQADVRQKALDRLKWAIDRADDLGADIICGPFHSAHGTFVKNAPQDNEYKWSAEILRAAGDYASKANVTLGLEAVNRFECYLCNTMAQLANLVTETGHPSIKAMFDTHHANIEEKKIRNAILGIAPSLAHVHISENDRGTPGEGHIDFDEAFEALSQIKYADWLTIEAFSRNDPAFANSIGVWREYSKPWDIAEHGLAFIKKMVEKHKQ